MINCTRTGLWAKRGNLGKYHKHARTQPHKHSLSLFLTNTHTNTHSLDVLMECSVTNDMHIIIPCWCGFGIKKCSLRALYGVIYRISLPSESSSFSWLCSLEKKMVKHFFKLLRNSIFFTGMVQTYGRDSLHLTDEFKGCDYTCVKAMDIFFQRNWTNERTFVLKFHYPLSSIQIYDHLMIRDFAGWKIKPPASDMEFHQE